MTFKNLPRLISHKPLSLLCLSAILALAACSPKQENAPKQSADENIKADAQDNANAQAADANKADAAQAADANKADAADANKADAADANKADNAQEAKTIAIEIFEPKVSWEQPDCEDGESTVTCRETIYGSKPEKNCKIEDDIDLGPDYSDLKEECILSKPFIMQQDYKSFNLKPGDEFQVPNGGKYKIIDGVPEEAYYYYGCCDGVVQGPLDPSSLHGHTNYKGDDNQIIRINVISAPTK